jgi:hypothetical protein
MKKMDNFLWLKWTKQRLKISTPCSLINKTFITVSRNGTLTLTSNKIQTQHHNEDQLSNYPPFMKVAEDPSPLLGYVHILF